MTAAARSRKRRIIASMSSVSAILAEASAGRGRRGRPRGRPPRGRRRSGWRERRPRGVRRRGHDLRGRASGDPIDSGSGEAGGGLLRCAPRATSAPASGFHSVVGRRTTPYISHPPRRRPPFVKPSHRPPMRQHRPPIFNLGPGVPVGHGVHLRHPLASATATAAAGRTLTPGRGTPSPATDGARGPRPPRRARPGTRPGTEAAGAPRGRPERAWSCARRRSW